MSIKKRTKKNLMHWADGGHGVWMHCVWTSMEVKKKKRKKNILKIWVCGRGHLVCGWSCVWMVLRADGLACGWSCVRIALHADVDCGGYRGGERR